MSAALVGGLLLHGDGWDELIMVAVGLIGAFAVISLTGRRADSDDQAEEARSEASADEKADHA